MRNILLRMGIKTYPFRLLMIDNFGKRVIAKYQSEHEAETSLKARILYQADWGVPITYQVNFKNKPLISNYTKGKK